MGSLVSLFFSLYRMSMAILETELDITLRIKCMMMSIQKNVISYANNVNGLRILANRF